jgi:TRAP-type C4-dicarboxylate transport system permease small subunit
MIDPMSIDTPAPSPAHDHGAARIARILALAGGFIVIGLALLVTTSILMRWLGGAGIDGDFEMVQMGLALAIFAFLPLCQAHRGNVMVDSFTTRLPKGAQAALDVLWDLVFAAFAGFIAWRLTVGAMEAFSSRTTSMVLALPIHYAIGACAGMAAFLALICCLTAVRRARVRS